MRNGTNYAIKEINGTRYILVSREHFRTKYPEANWQNTGMALCGVLRPGEKVEDYHKRMKQFRKYQKDELVKDSEQKAALRKKIATMRKEGVRLKEICNEYDISASTVRRLVDINYKY